MSLARYSGEALIHALNWAAAASSSKGKGQRLVAVMLAFGWGRFAGYRTLHQCALAEDIPPSQLDVLFDQLETEIGLSADLPRGGSNETADPAPDGPRDDRIFAPIEKAGLETLDEHENAINEYEKAVSDDRD